MAGYNGDGGDRNRNIEGLGKDKVMDYQQEVGDEPDTTNVFCYSGIGAGNISNSVVRASEVQEVGEEFACLSSFNSHPFRIRNPIRLKDLNKNHADASKAVKAVKEEQRRKDEVDKLKMQVEKLIETVDDLTADNKKLNSTVSHLQCQLTGMLGVCGRHLNFI
ncbi:unnamed protein product [Orchesella dallaii]|uniref:BZIP domain-containing protein n=1 Tax=Orchesella dallaii TaxID=48710 RepID=A0ABP1RDR9_9HEXA